MSSSARGSTRSFRHYVDESKSGKKVAGRDQFQKMLRDAALGQFDVIVVWDITRFARDGFDIISNARALKINFGIAVKDTCHKFDTERESNLENYLHAGIADDERLRIMKRTMVGRIANAEKGLPWCGTRPPGRTFEWKDGTKKSKAGEWVITDYGKRLQKMLKRYAEGERLRDLQKEYNIQPAELTRVMRESGLSGEYVVTFNAPEIGIVDKRVTVPGMLELISPALEKKVRSRLAARRCYNHESVDKYRLTGFVCCADCGRGLVGHTDKGYEYYRHKKQDGCSFSSIHHDVLERNVLAYLYGFVHDEPTYREVIKASLPSEDDRKEVEANIAATRKKRAGVDKKIERLVDAIADGIETNTKSVGGRLKALEAEQGRLDEQLEELEQTLATMPSRKQVESEALMARIQILESLKKRDWTKLPFREIRRFLHFLFGANPRSEGYGIFLSRDLGKWVIEFRGRVEFDHDVLNERVVSKAFQKMADVLNEGLVREYRERLAEIQSNGDIDVSSGNIWPLLL